MAVDKGNETTVVKKDAITNNLGNMQEIIYIGLATFITRCAGIFSTWSISNKTPVLL